MSMNIFNVVGPEFDGDDIHLRTMRTSFLQKIADAYKVFAGGRVIDLRESAENYGDYNKFPGLFDYLTLGLFHFIGNAYEKRQENTGEIFNNYAADNKEKNNSYMNKIIASLHFIGNTIARPMVAGIFTLISLPVIAGVQLVASAIQHAMQAWLKNSVLPKLAMPHNIDTFQTTQTLGALMSAAKKAGLNPMLLAGENQKSISICSHQVSETGISTFTNLGSYTGSQNIVARNANIENLVYKTKLAFPTSQQPCNF